MNHKDSLDSSKTDNDDLSKFDEDPYSYEQVKIIQVNYGVASLQDSCREVILHNFSKTAINRMPLPKRIREFVCADG